jgi:hypothetical protein
MKAWKSLYHINPAICAGCRPVELAPFVQDANFTGITRQVIVDWMIASEIVTARKE